MPDMTAIRDAGEERPLEERIAALLRDGARPVLLTVLQKEGGAPCAPGTRALLTEAGLEGAGEDVMGAAALETARDCLLDGLTRFVRCAVAGGPDAPDDGEDGPDGADGGHADVLCEALHPSQEGLFSVAARALEGDAPGVWLIDMSDVDAPRRMLCLSAAPEGFAPAERAPHAADAPPLSLEAAPSDGAPLPDNVFVDGAACAAYLEQARRPSLFGGETPLYVEPLRPRPVLLLCGGGRTARETAALAHAVGFVVDVVDCHEEAVAADRFPQARNRFVTPDFADLVARCGVGRRHYVLIGTENHAHELAALAQALRSHAWYIGMLGGGAGRRALFAALRDEGVPDAELACIRCPSGLPVGAESPRERAVAIVAELLAARAGVLHRLCAEEDRS